MSTKFSFVRNVKWLSSITGVVQVTAFEDSPEISPLTEILAKGWDGQKSQIGPAGPPPGWCSRFLSLTDTRT